MTIQPAVFFSLLLASLSLPSFSLTPPSEKFRAAYAALKDAMALSGDYREGGGVDG